MNGPHALLIVLGNTRYFPELEYAQEIINEWLIAKYRGQIEVACKVGEVLWRLNHVLLVLLEEIEKTGETLLSNNEIPGKDALEKVMQNYSSASEKPNLANEVKRGSL